MNTDENKPAPAAEDSNGASPAPEAPRETQTVNAGDVGKVEDVLGHTPASVDPVTGDVTLAEPTPVPNVPLPPEPAPYPPPVDPERRYEQMSGTGVRSLAELREVRLLALVQLLPILGSERGKISKLLAGWDIGTLRPLLGAIEQLFAIEEPIDSPKGIRLRVLAALALASVFARIVPGQRDDDFVNTIEKVIQFPHLLDVVSELVSGVFRQPIPAGTIVVCSVGDVENVLHGQQVTIVQAAAIDPATIVTLVQLIVTIWRSIRK
jgi:hypothetical protein